MRKTLDGPWARAAIVLALVTLLGFVAAACGSSSSSSPSAASGPIKIGFFAPESGFAAADGASAYEAAKLAVSEINKAGGIGGRSLELVNYDDASDPKQAVTIATRLVTQDKVDAVVSGSYSDQTLAAAPIFQRNSIPLLAAYAVNPGIPATGNFVFQQDGTGTVQGRAGAFAMVKDLGVKKIAIVAVNNDFGTALVEGFTQEATHLGAQVVATDYNQFGEKDFTPILSRDKSKGATGYYMVEYAAEAQQFISDWNTLGFKYPLLGTEGLDSTKGFLEPVGKAAEGLIFTTSFNRDSTEPVVQAFIQAFTSAAGFAPDMVPATAYDAFFVLKQAMANGTSPTQIRDGIASTKNFVGVTGTIQTYNSVGEVVKAVDLEVIKNGQVHHYGVISDPAIITP
jgi:branched-chain amino acid transport system substrate-binding protein